MNWYIDRNRIFINGDIGLAVLESCIGKPVTERILWFVVNINVAT